MRRRRFVQLAAASLPAAAALPRARAVEPDAGTAASYLTADVRAADTPFPKGKRPPFGWRAVPIPAAGEGTLRLSFPAPPDGRAPAALRFTIALDYRAQATVAAVSAESGRALGTADVRFTQAFQPFSVDLPQGDAAVAAREGVELTVAEGPGPLWVLSGDPGDAPEPVPDALAPHLMLPGTDGVWEEFFRRFGSLASLQPFGWMEGCVLDGLLDLAELPERAAMRAVAERHLALFTPGGELSYEGSRGNPLEGRASGVEGTLPFAAIARLDPANPLIEIVLKHWDRMKQPGGVVGYSGGRLTGEDTYTLAYPMAVIGRGRGSEELMESALIQVRARQTALFDGTEYYRVFNGNGSRSDRGWARGVAWHLLGTARTLDALKRRDLPADLRDGFRAFADWTLARQLPAGHPHAGLWSVFVHDPDLTPDTSGSAGIAAALAIGVRNGWLGEEHAAAADRTRAALTAFLTPDGFLGGVAQSNKGGRGLQEGDYRVLFQMGMGLTAQLIAARASRSDDESRDR